MSARFGGLSAGHALMTIRMTARRLPALKVDRERNKKLYVPIK